MQLKGERKNQQAGVMGGSGGGVRSQGRHPAFWRRWGLAARACPLGSQPGLPPETSLRRAACAPDPQAPLAPAASPVTLERFENMSLDIWGQVVVPWAGEHVPGHGRVLSSVPGSHPVDARSTLPQSSTRNVSRRRQVPLNRGTHLVREPA